MSGSPAQMLRSRRDLRNNDCGNDSTDVTALIIPLMSDPSLSFSLVTVCLWGWHLVSNSGCTHAFILTSPPRGIQPAHSLTLEGEVCIDGLTVYARY